MDDLYDLCVSDIKPDAFRRALAKHDPKEWNEVYETDDSDAYGAFHAACQNQSDVKVFEAIFEHVGMEGRDNLWKQTSKSMKQGPLHFLAIRIAEGTIDVGVMEYLLGDGGGGAYWTKKDAEGWTPLHYALDFGFGERSKIRLEMLHVCLVGGGATALFLKEPNYGYVPFWGVMAKKETSWIEVAMRSGASKLMMTANSDVSKRIVRAIEDGFGHVLMNASEKKELVTTIQRDLTRWVADLPHSRGYLEGEATTLQDLPKHLIEDKIIPKIGGYATAHLPARTSK